MAQYNKVLFVSLCSNNDKPALKQALSVTRNNNAAMDILSIVPSFERTYQDFHNHILDSTKHYIEHLVQETLSELEIEPNSISIGREVITHSKANEATIRKVMDHNYDLVIKGCESSSKNTGYRAVDMALLRQCPVPVWLCRPIEHHRDEIKVAVAVDAFATAANAESLATHLLHTGMEHAKQCDGKLRIISSVNSILHTELRDNLFLRMPQDKIDAEVKKENQNHMSLLNGLIASSGIDGNFEVHQLEGFADDAIPHFVMEQNIDILVMGTLVRTGIPGILIGNTAENILQQLPCSVFAIKPADFVSPLANSK